MIGSFPYNGEAPLGHGSTMCISPSHSGGPSLRARQHEMRKTFTDRDLDLDNIDGMVRWLPMSANDHSMVVSVSMYVATSVTGGVRLDTHASMKNGDHK